VVFNAWSRRVVGWVMETHLRTELVLAVLNMAVTQRHPVDVIHHSGQGCQYTSVAFGKRCREAGVRPSVGSVGDVYGNALCEGFFATLECSIVNGSTLRSRPAWRSSISSRGWYNLRRWHSRLNYLSPIAFEKREALTRSHFKTCLGPRCPSRDPRKTKAFGPGISPDRGFEMTSSVSESGEPSTEPEQLHDLLLELLDCSSFRASSSLGRTRNAFSVPSRNRSRHFSTSATVSPCFRAAVSPFRVLRINDARRFVVQRCGDSGLSSAKAHFPPESNHGLWMESIRRGATYDGLRHEGISGAESR